VCVVKSLRLITFVERSVVNVDRSECNHVLGGEHWQACEVI
jgi:hypothetical protein